MGVIKRVKSKVKSSVIKKAKSVAKSGTKKAITKAVAKTIMKRGAKALIGEIPFASAAMEGIGAVRDIRGAVKPGKVSTQRIGIRKRHRIVPKAVAKWTRRAVTKQKALNKHVRNLIRLAGIKSKPSFSKGGKK